MPFGDFPIEVLYLGPAHSSGDIVVWLPQQKLVISGDMAFHERMLPVFSDTDTRAWIETWETAFEPLGATYVIPGYGHPTNMDQVRRYTRDYLVWLRKKIGAHLDAGGDLAEAYYVDQSPFAHLDTFDELATKNAGRVFEQMEFELFLRILRKSLTALCPNVRNADRADIGQVRANGRYFIEEEQQILKDCML